MGFSPISRVSHECLWGQWGKMLADNPAGHCFVLRSLVLISFFKKFMIVLLKMYGLWRIFDKICLKPFFPICDLWSGDKWTRFSGGGWYSTEGERSSLFACRETLPFSPILLLSGASWSLHKENAEDGAYSDFENSRWEYFLSDQ